MSSNVKEYLKENAWVGNTCLAVQSLPCEISCCRYQTLFCEQIQIQVRSSPDSHMTLTNNLQVLTACQVNYIFPERILSVPKKTLRANFRTSLGS